MPFFEPWHRMDANYFEVEEGCDFSYPLHVHHCYEAVFLTEGEMEVTVDGEICRLVPGDAALIFPNRVHALQSKGHSRHRLIIFAPELIAAFHHSHTSLLPDSAMLRLKDSPAMSMLGTLTPDSNIYAVKGALYSLCAAAQEQMAFSDANASRGGNVSLLRDILTFIQEHFREDCTLAALSAAIKYDMTYLSKFFTANVGTSFTAYVNRVRISHACYLLLNTDRSVLDISHECGNLSLRTFNRNFLSLRGCTPSEYRACGATKSLPLL